MPHQILQDRKRRRLHIHIPPVHPRVVRPQRRRQQPIPRPRHQLPPARLRLEPVTALHVLVDLLPKVLLDDRYLPKVHLLVLPRLDLLHAPRQRLERLVLGVGHEERKVDQVVRVRQVAQVQEEHGQVLLGVAQRHAHQDALLALPPARRALHVG